MKTWCPSTLTGECSPWQCPLGRDLGKTADRLVPSLVPYLFQNPSCMFQGCLLWSTIPSQDGLLRGLRGFMLLLDLEHQPCLKKPSFPIVSCTVSDLVPAGAIEGTICTLTANSGLESYGVWSLPHEYCRPSCMLFTLSFAAVLHRHPPELTVFLFS